MLKGQEAVIFVSIPRTGTHSVRAALNLPKKYNHLSARTLIRRLSQDTWDNAYVFTFIRHPLPRIASWFKFHKGEPPYRDLTFKQWVMSGCPNHWTDRASRGVDPEANPLSLTDFLCAESGKVLVPHVFDTDRMGSGLRTICRDTGMELHGVPHLNASPPMFMELDAQVKARVLSLFFKDFELFGYRG